MKIFICLILSIFPVFGQISQNNKEFNDFLNALAFVESSNNPKAYNSKEKAIGIYQIRIGYFTDSQNFNPKLNKYTHKDCFNPEISKLVVITYFSKYELNNLNNNNFEALAKAHNGGPNWKKKTGRAKSNLDIYWQKIRAKLNVRN